MTSSGQVFSKCPGKCKIGKLGLEVKERLDTRLIWGLTYRDIIEEFPEAQLNLANISTHKSKHTRPYLRTVMV